MVFSLLIVAFLIGCEDSKTKMDNEKIPERTDIPDSIRSLENLTIISSGDKKPDSVELVQEFVIEGSEVTSIDGFMRAAVVDSLDRLYLLVQGNRGNASLYCYQADGSLRDIIDLSGRGPGEFEIVRSIDISGDRLYLFGSLEKMAVYSIDDLSLIYDELIEKDSVVANDILPPDMIGKELYATDDELIVSFGNINVLAQDKRLFYFNISTDGVVLPQQVMEVRVDPYYLGKPQTFANGMELRSPIFVPFSRHTVTRFSDHGSIYTLWTEDFLIKEYDRMGRYKRALYYPVSKVPMSLSNLRISDSGKEALQEYELPNTWPAVYTMILDDEERMWVASITESDSSYTWRAINSEGKIEAVFNVPGNKIRNSPGNDPLIIINNGYFYIKENTNDLGNQKIVKYKMEFIEQ